MSNTPEPVRVGGSFYRSRVRRLLTVTVLLIGIVVIGTLRSGVALAQYTPSLQTDRTAYAAGDEIAINGQGFAPHEQVTFMIAREDGSADPQLGVPWTAAADESGAVTTTSVMTGDDNVGRRFVVVAVGPASGESHSLVFVRSPLVSTDGGVYVAGDTVIITGRDFRAGESVTIRVVHGDGTAEPGMGHEPVDATVQADGTFAASWVLSNDDLAGPLLKAVVVGAVSGEIPAAEFLRVADLSRWRRGRRRKR